MKRSKRISLISLCVTLFLMNAASVSYASQRVSAHLNPDVTIQVGDQVKSFFDANGQAVFPIIYQGTTYLPVRAISALMGENIEWDSSARTVFIGRTLSNPGGVPASRGNYIRVGTIPPVARPSVQIIEARVMHDIIIMYNFEAQSFLDATGREVFPINFQGSNYLPVRAIAQLMGETIEWDPGQRLITISDRNAPGNDNTEETPVTPNEHIEELNAFLADVVAIFDSVTAKVVRLQHNLSATELAELVVLVSGELQSIEDTIADIRRVNTSGFSELELEAYNSLLEYAEAAGYYVLITENIVYMAAMEQDFSIFAETFLHFAMNAQFKFETARDALRAL